MIAVRILLRLLSLPCSTEWMELYGVPWPHEPTDLVCLESRTRHDDLVVDEMLGGNWGPKGAWLGPGVYLLTPDDDGAVLSAW